MSQYYPLFIDLSQYSVLVVGGGTVALRKTRTLLDHGAKVYLVSPELIRELHVLVDNHRCIWFSKEYDTSDLSDAMLVFSCTEKEDVNKRVAMDAKAAGCLVNVVDDPEKCSFIVPSIMERGDLCIAVSTGGSSPIVARQIRCELEEQYGEEMSEYLTLLRSWRNEVKKRLSPENRKIFWNMVTDGRIMSIIQTKRIEEAKGVMEECFRSLLD